MTDKQEQTKLANELKRLYPTARPRVVEIFVEALALHAKKNHDYCGDDIEFASLGTLGRFCDITRKFNRLHTLVVKGKANMVLENKRDTAIDLCVYGALICEDIERDEKSKKK